MEDNRQLLATISGYVGKRLRDHFGKGPESVYVSIGSTFCTVYLRNFISPMERVLMDQDQELVVRDLRARIMDKLLPELGAFLKEATGCEVGEWYYDWSLPHRSGMLLGISSEPFAEGDPVDESYPARDEMNETINEISEKVQKLPEDTYSCLLNPRTLVVIRSGILMPIEKEIIRQGHGGLLRNIKAYLEGSYLQDNERFHAILGTQVTDVFVDWDFSRDKSGIVFILQPNQSIGGNDLDMAHMS